MAQNKIPLVGENRSVLYRLLEERDSLSAASESGLQNLPCSRLIKCLLWFLVALGTADGIITKLLIGSGSAREGNPLMEPLVGEILFVPVKVLGALVCAYLFWTAYKKNPRLSLAATSSFVIIYAGIVLWNVSLFLIPRA